MHAGCADGKGISLEAQRLVKFNDAHVLISNHYPMELLTLDLEPLAATTGFVESIHLYGHVIIRVIGVYYESDSVVRAPTSDK